MELLKICLSSFISLLSLFVFMKILGNRQMSQLSMFDYVNGITIGSIAAEMATSLEDDFIKPLVAMLVYTVLMYLMSLACSKSIKARKIINGKSYLLYQNGRLIEKNFKKSKLDINEFLTQCRINGYFNLADLDTAILETNGNVSFIPTSTKRPVIPEDLELSPVQEKPVFNVIIDGQIVYDNLKATGNDINWLHQNLKRQKENDISKIFLATCDTDNNLSVYIK